jgi:hypothetical protein
MYRFPAIEHMLQFGAKRRIGEVVDQVNRPEQTPDRDTAIVYRLSACG